MSRHRNNAWYSYQENSTYPLSPDASLEGSGGPLPNDLLTDCRIVLTGEGASDGAVFLSVLDVNCGHVSLILSLTWNEGTEEILCFSDDAVKIDTIYPLEPLRPGVRGWVTFGSGVLSRVYNSLFEDRDSEGINTSRIIERCLSRPYGSNVISGVQKYGTSQILTGDVRLIPSSRLTVGEKTVLFADSPYLTGTGTPDTEVRLLEFSLPEDLESELPFPLVLAEGYAAAESPNVPEPKPIRDINTDVTPDCDGKITLLFDERFIVHPASLGVESTATRGVLISSAYSLADICASQSKTADENGLLPSEQAKADDPDACPKTPRPDYRPPDPADTSDWPSLPDDDPADTPFETGNWTDLLSWHPLTGPWEEVPGGLQVTGSHALAGINFGACGSLGINMSSGLTVDFRWLDPEGQGKFNLIAACGIVPDGDMKPLVRYSDMTLRRCTMIGAAIHWTGLGGKGGVIRFMRYHRAFWEPLAEAEWDIAFNIEHDYRLDLRPLGTVWNVVASDLTAGLFQSLSYDAGTPETVFPLPANGHGLFGVMSYYSAFHLTGLGH